MVDKELELWRKVVTATVESMGEVADPARIERTARMMHEDLSVRQVPNRQCGECTLCCKVVEVEEINKPRGEWCRFSRSHKGCSLYPNHPISCKQYSCMWLLTNLPDEMRPDRIHAVIDLLSTPITAIVDNKKVTIQCVQVFVDPKFPDAYNHGILKSFIVHSYRLDATATLIRTPSGRDDKLLLVNPGDPPTFKIMNAPADDRTPEQLEHTKGITDRYQSILATPKHKE